MNVIAKTASYLNKNGLKATLGKMSRRLSRSDWLSPEEDGLFEITSSGSGCITSCPFDIPEKCPDYEDKVSVIIPVYNGEKELKELLHAIKAQKGISSVEIVAVDSGSTDASVSLAESYGAVIVPIDHESFTHSLARRLGAGASSGTVFVFMTQDALPEDEFWLSKLIYPVTSLDCAAASCWEKPRSDADLFARVSSYTWDIVMEARNRISVLPEDESYESLRYCAQLSDNACAVKAEEYFSIGGHQGVYAEDLDLGLRLLREGKCVAQLSSPRVIHSHNRDAEYYYKRAITDAVSMKKLFPMFVLDGISPEESANRILTAYITNSLFLEALEQTVNTDNLKEFVREKYNECIVSTAKMKKEEAAKLFRDSDLSFVKSALERIKSYKFDAGLAVSQARYLMHSVQPYLENGGSIAEEELPSALWKYFGQSSGYTFAASHMGRGGVRISELEKYSNGV